MSIRLRQQYEAQIVHIVACIFKDELPRYVDRAIELIAKGFIKVMQCNICKETRGYETLR